MTDKPNLTIFTPTYNRVHTLNILFDSLMMQSNRNFCWLIVDDGSTDSTRDAVESYVRIADFKIKYLYQNNSGKYIAHNKGVENCITKYFVCVDSDEKLLPHAVELINKYCEYIENRSNIAGIVSPKKLPKKSIFNDSIQFSTLMDLYQKRHFSFEGLLVYKSSILKDNLFPVIVGEKFMTEKIIYNVIDNNYKLLVLNEYICETEYLINGLSSNSFRLQFTNIKSTLLSFQNNAAFSNSLIYSIKNQACYYAWKKCFKLNDIKYYKVSLIRKVLSIPLILHYLRIFKYKYKLFKKEV